MSRTTLNLRAAVVVSTVVGRQKCRAYQDARHPQRLPYFCNHRTSLTLQSASVARVTAKKGTHTGRISVIGPRVLEQKGDLHVRILLRRQCHRSRLALRDDLVRLRIVYLRLDLGEVYGEEVVLRVHLQVGGSCEGEVRRDTAELGLGVGEITVGDIDKVLTVVGP